MEDKIFIAPRLTGSRFEDHTLPVNILEDFSALEDLIIEVAKGIFLAENQNRKRVPKGFSDGIYLKLVAIEEGSTIPMFIIASIMSIYSSLPLENIDNFTYFEKAKDKIVSIIETVNAGQEPSEEDGKYLSFFNKIGKNLLDDEAIDFGYNHISKTSSSAVLNKITRKKILLSREQKSEYTDNIKLFSLIPGIDQDTNTFFIETEYGKIPCPLNEDIKETVLTALTEYDNKMYVSIKGTALFSWNDKVTKIEEIESMDILDSLDVSLRINNLLKLENNWYEGKGKALNKDFLTNFGNYFDLYFNNKLPLPAIFPKLDGNIQLEWKRNNKNIIIDIQLDSLNSDFFFYNDNDDNDEFEQELLLNTLEEWTTLNKLIEKYI